MGSSRERVIRHAVESREIPAYAVDDSSSDCIPASPIAVAVPNLIQTRDTDVLHHGVFNQLSARGGGGVWCWLCIISSLVCGPR